MLQPNRIEFTGSETEALKDRWSDLASLHLVGHSSRCKPRIRHQQHDVAVVVGETAVLGDLLGSTGISDANVGRYNDVRRARIKGRIVKDQIKRRTRKN